MWFFQNSNALENGPADSSRHGQAHASHPQAGSIDEGMTDPDEVETQEEDEVMQAMMNASSSQHRRRNKHSDPTPVKMRSHSELSGSGHEVIDRSLSMVSSADGKSNGWICKPYKREVLEQQFNENSPGSGRRVAIIAALRELGVKIYVLDSKSTRSNAEVLQHVKRVVAFVARENCVEPRTGPLGFQRCLLYQDEQGRLFNLTLSQHSIGPVSLWKDYLESFSGLHAMIGLTVLCRSLPCITQDPLIRTLQPAYLSLILGLVLTEEIGLSFLNASMLVRACPSVSAHQLMTPVSNDLFRKLIVFVLAIAGATTGVLQNTLTMMGVGGACMALLANLGARAWHFMRWRPIHYQGPGASVFAYGAAMMAGALVPYMGHRTITVGGKGAMEYIIKTAVIVGIVFVASDFPGVQKFLVLGSEYCPQDLVNFTVGVWWAVTLICSLFLVRHITYQDQRPEDGEQLLVEDHASPVGYTVPTLPNFEIDPTLIKTGISWVSLQFELVVGLVVALIGGASIVYLAFYDWQETALDGAKDVVNGLF